MTAREAVIGAMLAAAALVVLIRWGTGGSGDPAAYRTPPSCEDGLVSIALGSDRSRLVCARDLDGELSALARSTGCEPPAEGWFEGATPAAGARLDVSMGGAGECVVSRGWMSGSEMLALGVRIDLNAAAESDLVALPGIGPVRARAIVEDRERHGPFGSARELSRVHGVGPATIERIDGLVTVRP